MRVTIVYALTLFATGLAFAGQRFECGGATVEISITRVGANSHGEEARTTLAVSRGGRVRELVHVGGIDFVGGQCSLTASGEPRVVFQAYCGGSGCKDLDGWGIADPRSLQFLLVPSDANRAEARRLLGVAPVPAREMLSVEHEVRLQEAPAK